MSIDSLVRILTLCSNMELGAQLKIEVLYILTKLICPLGIHKQTIALTQSKAEISIKIVPLII